MERQQETDHKFLEHSEDKKIKRLLFMCWSKKITFTIASSKLQEKQNYVPAENQA